METVIEMDEEGKIGTKKTTINFITLQEHFPKTTSNGKDAKNGCYFDEEQMLGKVAIEKMNPKLTTNKDLRVDEENTREDPKGEKNASYEVTDATDSSDHKCVGVYVNKNGVDVPQEVAIKRQEPDSSFDEIAMSSKKLNHGAALRDSESKIQISQMKIKDSKFGQDYPRNIFAF